MSTAGNEPLPAQSPVDGGLPPPGPGLGVGIIANNGGGVIGNNGAALTGRVLAPAGIIANNGGGVVSTGGGAYRLQAAAEQVPVADAIVRLVDATGAAVKGADGQPLEARTNAAGTYAFPVLLAAHNLVAVAELGGQGVLQAVIAKDRDPAKVVDVEVVSTLSTAYIREKYVAPVADKIATFDRLPAAVEAETRSKTEAALTAKGPALTALTPVALVSTVEALRAADPALDAQFEAVRRLLVVGGASVSATDGPALGANVPRPMAVALDEFGDLYVLSGTVGTLRRVTPDGQIATVAGREAFEFLDGKGAAAGFSEPVRLAPAPGGGVYVLERTAVRRVTRDGIVTTLAGGSTRGMADGVGGAAKFEHLLDMAAGPDGLYVADINNRNVRRVDPAGRVTTAVPPSAFAAVSSLARPTAMGLAADGTPLVKVSDAGAATDTFRIDAATGTLIAAPRDSIGTIHAGYLYTLSDKVILRRPLSANGTPGASETWAGKSWSSPPNAFGQSFPAIDGPGTDATFNGLESLCVDRQGNLYVADSGNHLIRKVSAGRVVTTIAGNGFSSSFDGQGSQARFEWPCGVADDHVGGYFVSDVGAFVVRHVDAAGNVTTVAGSGRAGARDGKGALADFQMPRGLAIDAERTVFVADSANKAVRRIAPDGTVSTVPIGVVPGSHDPYLFPFEVAVAPDGALFVTVADNYYGGTRGIKRIDRGGATSWLMAPPQGPIIIAGIAVDPAGGVLIGTNGFTVRRYGPDGAVSDYIRPLGGTDASFLPQTMALAANGDVFMGNFDGAIKRLSRDGRISDVTIPASAGTLATTHTGGLGLLGMAVTKDNKLVVALNQAKVVIRFTP